MSIFGGLDTFHFSFRVCDSEVFSMEYLDIILWLESQTARWCIASKPNHIIAISKKIILCGHLVNCCVIIFSISICSLSLSAGCFPRRKRIWWKKPFPWNALQPTYTTYCPIKVYITYHFGYFPIWQFNALIQRLLHNVLKL